MEITSKPCCTCLIDKPFSDYYKGKLGKYGFHSSCKECMLKYQKKYHDDIKPIRKEKAAKRYLENKEKSNKASKAWYNNNKSRVSEYSKKWSLLNKEKRVETSRQYYQKNKRKLLDGGNKWKMNKINSDPIYKTLVYLRNRTRQGFKVKGLKKHKRTEDLLGVDIITAKLYLEKQFTKGMNWSNQGKWHIDHKIPLSSAKNEEELIALCHYTNLQPLWATDNNKKSDKILPTQMTLTI